MADRTAPDKLKLFGTMLWFTFFDSGALQETYQPETVFLCWTLLPLPGTFSPCLPSLWSVLTLPSLISTFSRTASGQHRRSDRCSSWGMWLWFPPPTQFSWMTLLSALFYYAWTLDLPDSYIDYSLALALVSCLKFTIVAFLPDPRRDYSPFFPPINPLDCTFLKGANKVTQVEVLPQ